MAQELEFYDVKSKEKFKTTDYEIRVKGGRNFAVADAPGGEHEAWRVVSKDFVAESGAKVVEMPDEE